MLTELLAVILNQNTLSLSELARAAGYTAGEAGAGLEQLARMGYIEKQELGQACGTCGGSNHCDSCPAARMAEPFPAWQLTNKGRGYLAKKKRVEP